MQNASTAKTVSAMGEMRRKNKNRAAELAFMRAAIRMAVAALSRVATASARCSTKNEAQQRQSNRQVYVRLKPGSSWKALCAFCGSFLPIVPAAPRRAGRLRPPATITAVHARAVSLPAAPPLNHRRAGAPIPDETGGEHKETRDQFSGGPEVPS